jgi:uncharacterized protein
MQKLKIGTAKGPGEGPHEFLFISPDESGHCKMGEFVYYTLGESPSPVRHVLGRITRRDPVRLLPDNFLASPDVPPMDIAASLGYVDQQDELFEVTVVVMGYFDEQLEAFINPRTIPRIGSSVFLASSEMLGQVLSRRKRGERGSAHVGWLLSREKNDVPIILDVNEFTSTHLSIIAGTGAGKSYLAGVVIEELMGPHNKACVLVVDPHGEYETLTDLPNLPEFCQDGYRPTVRVMTQDKVKVRINTLTLDDLRYLLPQMGERMEWILTDAFNRTQQKSNDWLFNDLYNEVLEIGEEHKRKQTDYSSSVDGLTWRLGRQLKNSSHFDDYVHLDLNQLFKPGQCTVLQLNEIDQRDQQVIVATLLRRLLRARMETQKKQVPEDQERYLPYPAFVLIEEAHHFAPASGDVISAGILKQILSEGRKFGVGVGLISQRPGKLDQDVLSQCMTHFMMRIVNPIDQSSVAGAVESVGRDLLDELPALSKGQVIIAGSSLNTPVICQTRPRSTRHGGVSIDAAARWEEYFRDRGQRERDISVIDFQHRRSQILQPED